jgi:hypothetical protein
MVWLVHATVGIRAELSRAGRRAGRPDGGRGQSEQRMGRPDGEERPIGAANGAKAHRGSKVDGANHGRENHPRIDNPLSLISCSGSFGFRATQLHPVRQRVQGAAHAGRSVPDVRNSGKETPPRRRCVEVAPEPLETARSTSATIRSSCRMRSAALDQPRRQAQSCQLLPQSRLRDRLTASSNHE